MFVKTKELRAALAGFRVFKPEKIVVSSVEGKIIFTSANVRVILPATGESFTKGREIPLPLAKCLTSQTSTAIEFVNQTGKIGKMVTIAPIVEVPEIDVDWEDMHYIGKAKDALDPLRYVAQTASTDETRPHINRIHFDSKRIVTTDGHRLHLAHLTNRGNHTLREAVNVDRRVGEAFVKMRSLVGKEDLIGVQSGVLISDRIFVFDKKSDLAAAFPPYDQVIPKYHECVLHLSVATLKNALKQLNLKGPKHTSGLKISATEGKLVFFERCQGQERRAVIRASYSELLGNDFSKFEGSIGVNKKYLNDALKHLDPTKTIMLCTSGPLDPLVLQNSDGDHIAVIMPMRI